MDIVTRSRVVLLSAASALALAGCLDNDRERDRGPGTKPGNDRPTLEISVLSSAPNMVSGGDVRIALLGKAAPGQLELWLNDQSIGLAGLKPGKDGLEGLVDGLREGDNRLEVHHKKHGKLAGIDLKNHPITGPIFSGPQQYPFVCSTVLELGKQPLVDAGAEEGFPVHDEDGVVIGYSRDCSLEPYVEYVYMSTDGSYQPLPADGSRPEDMATTTLDDGRTVDFVVRWERGTINRFIYSYATLASLGDRPDKPKTDNWNGRLLFHFQGGVGIGHFQGRMDPRRAKLAEALSRGYAVAYSTGTRTGDHYNLEVGGETALMVKEHFIKRFGTPLYTVAIGGSGGGIQQYVYAQNHPGLLDAAVPQYSYPDMVTQTIHIGDCELLEHYMDVTDRSNPKWQITANRSWLVGLHATDAVPDPLAGAKLQLGYGTAPGSTECIASWRGLTPLSMNPHYGQVREQHKMQPPELMEQVHWTHYDDLRNIYGIDDNGYARVSWDNVGVQYGLQALRDGHITPEEFLHLNWHVGGWKAPHEMVQEGFPFLGSQSDVLADPSLFDPWSRRNMRLGDEHTPAPRTEADLKAVKAGYRSGMVFDGQIDIPVIDWRHYLEHELDMHNVHQSFSVRQRIRNKMGHSDHQLVWFTDARPERESDHTWLALEVIDEWMDNIRRHPERSLAENRPQRAVDSCFSTEGELIASGDDVWNGILDEQAPGACTQQFPLYSTSRMVAGGPIEGSIFKCQLQSVDTAIAKGVYGSWQPNAEQKQKLEQIFPDGVCDYSKPDAGRP